MTGPEQSEAVERIEEALWRAAEARLPAAALAPAELARAVVERSRRYTSCRELLDEPLSGSDAQADLAARVLFFAVTDAGKIAIPLAELAGRDLLPATRPVRVLDLGAGAGAMTLGTAAFLAERQGEGRPVQVQVTAIDRDRPALGVFGAAARALAESLGGRIELTVRTESVRDATLGSDRFDLILAGTVLNELDPAGRRSLVERALTALDPRGAIILIEPALRETSRDLHQLRDDILAREMAHVFAPCTRTAAPCPALARDRDWCHEDRPLALPPRAARIAAVTGLRDDGMKFSYLVLRRGAEPLFAAPPGYTAHRLVSEPRKQKGRRECLACGDFGWVALRLLSRRRSEQTRRFERARRGDLVVLDSPVETPRHDLGTDDREIEIVSPARPA